MTLTLFYLYIINVVLSLSSIACVFYFYTRDYSKLKLVETYFVYWFVTLFSFLYSLLEILFIYQYNLLQTLRERYPSFPYIVLIISLFLTVGWLISSILSTFILKECLSVYENCDIIIALTTFGLSESLVWIASCGLAIYYLYYQTNQTITIQENVQENIQEPIQEIQMQEIQEIWHPRTQISYAPPFTSYTAEIVDAGAGADMQEVKL